jgi:hypothetical protein
MLSFTMGGASANNVPEGNYYAEWISVEDYQDTEKRYGPGIKWSWRIIQGQGEHSGKTLSRITQAKPTPSNACGKMIVALLGRTPKEGEAVDLSHLVGKKYLCKVAKTQNGGVRVETVSALP